MAERRVGPVRGHARANDYSDGRARCECGAESALMGTEQRRAEWHRSHRQQIIRDAGAETVLRRGPADGTSEELAAARAEVERLRAQVAVLLPYALAGADALDVYEPYGPTEGHDTLCEGADTMLDRIRAGEFGQAPS